MMSLKTSSLLCLIFLLRITAALGTEWSVKYSQRNLCALKGSTVFMNVTYTHPTRLTVKDRFWLINPVKGKEPTDLCNEPGYSGRVQYLTDGQNHFSLRLSDVKKTDEHMYCFRITTNEEKDKYTGYPGVTLTVTDHLDVQITPAEVTEGQSAVLTCKTTCNLTDPTFIWYKNSHHLTTKTSEGNEVRLQSVSSEDAGSYSCAVRGYEHHSPAQTLRVRYGPKNVSVSISPSGEIVEGSSVTLTCSSDANPPVKTYTWYKQATSVGTEKTYTISKISSMDTGEYKCKCSNEVGHQESSSVSLNVLYPPKNVSVSISPSGEIVEGSSVTLTCSSDANPPVKTYEWFKGTTSVGNGKTYTISKISSMDTGEYKCKCSNEVGHQESSSVTLNVLYGPKNVSVSISPSGEIVEGSSVTLTCSSDANPPVQTYTWYKQATSVGTEKTYTISKISSMDTGEYKCKCSNEVGHQESSSVSLNVLYPPKNVSVSISPSGEIVEGSSVTLTCSSDANPPVKTYTWYKQATSVGTEKTYTISKISSMDTGEYKCKCSNEVGHQESSSVSLNVLYPPKNVSVSISPSGEIVEGSSVTLTCSTDANPPVKTYTWYKQATSVGTEKTYTISKISSMDTGEYKCKCSNEVGHQESSSVTLNVLYPPKNVSVSISPSGEIVEGSSVTLTCSSDANPPVQNYTWYKQATSVGNEKTYTISKISSMDTGEYKCKCSNEVGHQESSSVTLNVLYPPKNVSVSISPSGEIVEGSSVTLTCSSDANPPVKTYTWYKQATSVGNEKTYTISKISSMDTGEYKCKCSNEVGHQESSSVTLNVLYPPKNVSVSISPSGEIVEGSSVTLTCSSDANPPVQNYTWYKGNESSPVGSGQSYRAVQSGQYLCEAQNKHGSERSAAVTVTLKGSQSVGVYAGLGVVLFVCICLTVTFWCIRKKKRAGSTPDQSLRQDNLYANIANPTNTVSDSASAHQDEVLYASVVHQRAVDPRKAESSAVKASASEDGEVQYASVRFKRTTTADYRPSNVEDPTVISSRVK
ncbi:B-cell receptor CD22-like isoform X1 [Hemibagrus wyckioides]|uniref:B-cell receptor CD22-like isoform X1 n=1 Tax=Hemibagrus wyckioides TaxID=337641 RepID=UPI00266C62A2|nr:B-cell receptor CD22-like isoform X1 [Hemibagrus wyckioides]XP_058236588.1 B-cell receptor CD22-like isoform X1 [Hemibagrus wyckioides]